MAVKETRLLPSGFSFSVHVPSELTHPPTEVPIAEMLFPIPPSESLRPSQWSIITIHLFCFFSYSFVVSLRKGLCSPGLLRFSIHPRLALNS